MNKHVRYFLLVFTCVTSVFTKAQKYSDINANNVRASFCADGNLFVVDTGHNGYTYSLYKIPKVSGHSTIFSASPWLTGLDAGNNVYGAFNYYENHNFRFGPVATSAASTYDSAYFNAFKVTYGEIRYHQVHFTDPGYIVPDDIAKWPGNGNITNGEPAMLAPFVDLNTNNIYEPSLGEYPDIYGDEAVFMMYNDSLGSPYYSCNPMHSEIHMLAYSFAVPSDSILYNATFLHFTICNRSAITYHDVRFSGFFDTDIGCYKNDRIGCDTILNTGFAYNDPLILDSGNVCISNEGYGHTKIAQGITFLNKKLSSFNSVDGSGPIEFLPNCTTIRNFQTGKWKDGSHIYNTGNGYNSSSQQLDYMYPGDPRDSTGWSELYTQSSNHVAAGDRRLACTVTVDSLRPNDSQAIDMALLSAIIDTPSGLLSEIGLLKDNIASVQRLYDQGLLFHSTSTTSAIHDVPAKQITVYPNPANTMLYLSEAMGSAIYSIIDVTGRVYAVSLAGKQIDISELASGVYVLRISQGSNSYNGRFVKE